MRPGALRATDLSAAAKGRLDPLALYPRPVRLTGVRLLSAPWFFRLPLVYLCAVVLNGGLMGAWIGELGFITALSSCNFFRFRSGAWRSIRI